MESVEEITSAVQLDSSKEKVENMYMLLSTPYPGTTKSRAECSTCSYFQVEKLVAAKVERVKNYRTLVNFSTKEMKEVNSQPLPLNSTLWRL